MAYSGTGAPPGTITYVLPGDSAATIQSKLNSVQAGNSLVFTGGAAYDFGGTTIVGKSGVTIWADGPVVIANAPGAGTHGAFDFSGKSDWTIGGKAAGQGFIFNGSLIDATNASGNWTIGNSQFNNQLSNGYDGSAIRMNGASFGTIINNDFTGAGGNVVGMYNLTNITIDGNHFIDCYEPISIQEPTTADTSLGNDIIIRRNVFEGTQRAAIEVGPASSGAEYFSGLVVDSNYFDNFNNTAGGGTLLAISLVGQAAQNTTVTNNFIRRGPADAGEVGVAIEMSGSGIVSGNTIVNFSFAALTYQSGWNFYGNTVYNDGSSPYFGFANNGSGTGTFGQVTVLTGSSATPAKPARVDWGGDIGVVVPPPSVTESLVSDTGISLLDGITASADLQGTATANAVVRFKIDGTAIAATATANANGAWSFTPNGLADGSHTIVASVTNASGATASTSLTFTLDSTAPVPLITGATFANSQVALTGTSEAGSTVSVYEGLTLIGFATAGSDGKWTMAGAADGTVAHWYGAAATDRAGNVGNSATYATVPNAPSAPPSVTAALASDTGASASDRITSSAALAGSTDANAIVRFKVDGASIAATATANASGAWSFTPAGLADGSHTIVASVTNAGGATASTTLAFTLDSKAPVPAITGAAFASGRVTLTGASEAGSTVSVYEGWTLIGTAIAGSDGKWTMAGAGDGAAPHWYGAVATDLAGNVGHATGDYRPVPAVTAKLARDTGASAVDQITSSAVLTGTADANAVVRFTVDGAGIAATATANASGVWSFAPAGLADGGHTIVASQTNASGMTGTSLVAFTLDTKAPVPVFAGIVASNGQATLTGSTGGAGGEAVSIYDGNSLVGTATTGQNGSFSLTVAAGGNVTHAYSATVTDLAGNVGKSAGKAYLGGSKADTMVGTAAADVIRGGAKADVLTGGGGADRFVYRSASDSTPAMADTINDFLHGVDKIDFTNITGINATAGVSQFQGKLAATGNVKLKAHGIAFIESGGYTQVLVNTGNADETVSATNSAAADMKIVLVGVNLGLTASDFMHV